MEYHVTIKQTFDGDVSVLCKIAESTEKLTQWLATIEACPDNFELISIVPVK